MYGKIFERMYDGTLDGHWEAIVTMQQLIVLADSAGFVDMTIRSISKRTSIPEDIIERGIEHLLLPDRYSRTQGEEGRRIIPMDEHRPWGWMLVNYEKYSKMQKMADKQNADRQRMANKRSKDKVLQAPKNGSVADSSIESQIVPNVRDVAHVDVDVDVNEDVIQSKDLSEKSDVIVKKKSYPDDFLEFWKLYPSNRRGSKPNALAAWKKMDADASALISDIQDRFINDERFANDEFIPHAERWIKNCEFESQGKPPSRFGDVTDKNIRTISNWMEK